MRDEDRREGGGGLAHDLASLVAVGEMRQREGSDSGLRGQLCRLERGGVAARVGLRAVAGDERRLVDEQVGAARGLRDPGHGPRVAAQHDPPAVRARLRDLPADGRDRVLGSDRGEPEAGQLDRVARLDRVQVREQARARGGADRAPDAARRGRPVHGQRLGPLARLRPAEERRQAGDVIGVPVGEDDRGQLGELARAQRELARGVRAAVDEHRLSPARTSCADVFELGEIEAAAVPRNVIPSSGGGVHLAVNCTPRQVLAPSYARVVRCSPMRRVPTVLLLAAAGAALAVLAAGCGGSSSSGVASLGPGTVAASTQPTTTAASPQDFQAAILSYVKCLRSQGFNIPDPNFQQGGGGGGGGFFGTSGINRNDPKFRKAQTKCRPILAAVRPQFSTADRQNFQDAALKFAQCMRKNGVNVPDPNFSQGGAGGPGGGGGGGLFGGSGIDRNDPKVQAAMQTCRSVFTAAGLRPGAGRGRLRRPPGGAPGP